jgi:hypothetical protein
MTNHPDDLDSELREAMHAASPPAEFQRDALRDRIAGSLAERARSAPSRGRPPAHIAAVWLARAAAAVLIFALGAFYGRANAPVVESVSSNAFAALEATLPANVPLSIQSAGTGYVASLALMSGMRDRLTPEQREQARQVALAVLSGAIAELATAGNGRLPNGVLETVLSYGVPTGGPTDPVVRYR